MVFNYQNYKSKEISTECIIEYEIEYKGIKGFVLAVLFKYFALLKFKSRRFKFVYQPKIKLVRMKDG